MFQPHCERAAYLKTLINQPHFFILFFLYRRFFKKGAKDSLFYIGYNNIC